MTEAKVKSFLGIFARVLIVLFSTQAINVFAQQSETIHHSLKVRLDPYGQHIAVDDTITFPAEFSTRDITFLLNNNLSITQNSAQHVLLGTADSSAAVGINSSGADTADSNLFSLSLPGNYNRVVLSYEGTIFQQTQQNSAQYSQSFSETSGIITDQGVYLNGASLWVPNFQSELVTFDMQVEFAESSRSWTAVSQGSDNGINSWAESNPMEEIYLIAADFTRYSAETDNVDMLVFLRQPDPNLAARYLDATQRYLALYEPLLGDYPFDKFALIENFWETGYGMPSFTLLGQQIIRFPFIIDSSYPHEILHNWWGNGVYPDYETGNWSEGLTAYLADHLFQEMNGLGHVYRKDNLIRYKNYVANDTDFPLSQFTSRNSAASQAVGYGKTMMLWHMLRQEVGDELFIEGLRQLYSNYKFQQIGFAEIARLFSELTQQDLQPFFDQWVNRTGAPQIEMSVEEASDNQARIMFAQIQSSESYSINIPVALFYAGEEEPQIYHIPLSQRFEGVMADNYENLEAVIVDPYFDVFRQLDREEIPPVIGQLFGATEISFVVPRENREQWVQLAESFAEGVDAEIIMVEDLTALPDDRSVWILGKQNPFSPTVEEAVSLYEVVFSDAGFTLSGSQVEYLDRSSVLTARHPLNDELAIGWIHVDDMVAMPGMIEKLPHYGKYSFLSFIGVEPVNDVKGVWSSPNSPMQWMKPDLPEGYQLAALPMVEPLAELPPKYLPEQLQRHILALASEQMQGRKIGTPGADNAASYIAQQFREVGLKTLGGTYIHQWTESVPNMGEVQLRNVIGVIQGSDRQLSARPVVLGAHYDHLGFDGGKNYYGADDNASGVSVMIEVAAKLARSFTPSRTIIFVAFSGEEFGLLGSKHFVESPPRPFLTSDLFAMVNMDSVGRLEGRDLQIFGGDSAYEWRFMAQGIGFTIGVNSSLVEPVIASSDHVSFLNNGIPAIHLFAGVHADYHQPSDTADKVDFSGMSDIALWVEEAMVFLADREAPLRITLDGAQVQVSEGSPTAREASLGTVPDFSFVGEGVRISDVTPGGAAEEAGLLPGDVLLRYNDGVITDLQNYSDLIRQSAPGDVIEMQIRRDNQNLLLPVTLKSR
ncbi:MAG: M20/M25/M40 family metallo-hydrolase [Gammaproteobacteria bacterium]|nr:M20/M25/M40 family metallo-hydrolase [Gammaproteobacteria bacterium]